MTTNNSCARVSLTATLQELTAQSLLIVETSVSTHQLTRIACRRSVQLEIDAEIADFNCTKTHMFIQ